MDVMLYIAAIFAFAPTLILMYAVLKKYTFPAVEQPFFSDPRLFGLFVVGMIAGTMLFMVYTYLDWRSMIYAVLFSAIQCLVLVAVLNLKRFHGKSDTVFYGYGLGLGMGCAMAFGTIYFLGTMIVGMGPIDAPGMIGLFVIALSYVLMFSALGTTIGEGIARLKPTEFALQGVFFNVAFGLILVAGYNNLENEILFYVCLLLAFAVAAVFFYYTMHVKLSRVVRDVLKKEGNTRKDVPK